MKNTLLAIASTIIISAITFILLNSYFQEPEVTPMEKPNDWIYNQRAYPTGLIDYDNWRNIQQQAISMRQDAQRNSTGTWELVGPENVGGRISDIELHPTDTSIIYVGAASGGIFKVTDYGQTVTPIFDNAGGSISIGDMVLDPNDPDIIYVGTGESSASSNTGAFPGTGMYKTTDGGNNWTNIGLSQTRFIGRVVVDPQNTDNIYVAAMGPLYSKTTDRGVYRSKDGGNSWQNVFYLNDSTGCIDISINPDKPDTIYASMWTRTRYPWGRRYTGPTAGVYRSVDGGDNWTQLTNGLPPSNNSTGKIAISVAPSNPDVVYAAWSVGAGNTFDAMYKSTDAGNSWAQINVTDMSSYYNAFGWYFGNVRVDPNDEDIVYVVGYRCYKSTNGGVTWNSITTGGVHVDQHGLYVHPMNSNFLVLGNDGGLYLSDDGGNNWTKSLKLPINQFYAIDVDPQFPNQYYGGTQDNGTIRTTTGNMNDWNSILGGDGFVVRVDPTDNNYVYAEWQNGGFSRSDDNANSMSAATQGISGGDRFNWNCPYTIDPSDPTVLYFGTQRIYKSTDRALNWSPISGDLTDGPHPLSSNFGTITTIDVAASDPNYIYAGTEDGNVWVTPDGGNNWNPISTFLPDLYVTKVAVHPTDEQTCYLTFSGYKAEDYQPHVFKTIDAGANWTDISSNLPAFPVNDIIIDPDSAGHLYIASDYGVWVSFNDGAKWEAMGTGLPTVSVFDLVFVDSTRHLFAGTYGRSMYKIDLSEISTKMPAVGAMQQSLTVYPNPANASVTILTGNSVAEKGSLRIYDISGKLATQVFEGQLAVGKKQWTINTSRLPAGNYLCRFSTETQLQAQQLIITH